MMVLKIRYSQLKVLHDSVRVDDDDILGSCGGCLVSSSNENTTSKRIKGFLVHILKIPFVISGRKFN